MAKYISVISGKGGVGKTTASLNLASAMKSFGRNVIVVDGNISSPNLALHLGRTNFETTINDVLRGKKGILEAIHEEKGLKIVPASISLEDLKNVDLSKFSEVLQDLELDSDIIIIDSSCGITEETLHILHSCDEAIIITNPDLASLTEALRTLTLAQELGKTITGVVVTKHKGRRSLISQHNIEAMLEVPLLAIIPDDKELEKAVMRGEPLVQTHPKRKSSKAYIELAARLLNEPL
jgi:septum site-determining protein MinD